MSGSTPVRREQPATLSYRLRLGASEPHEVEVRFGPALRVLTVKIDGQQVYRHWDRAPWASRRSRDFKLPGREAHTLVVDPPGGRNTRGLDARSYVVWLDGQPVLRVGRDGAAGGASTDFTGERPGRGALFAYDEARHAAAYRLARRLVGGRRVLDAGCGDGYGTASLAGLAKLVVGVDSSAAAIAGCRMRWREPDLRFEVGDVARPSISTERFDVVLAFQILEHMQDPVAFLRALQHRLLPGGLLLLTTPNRLTSATENPYHVREYTAAELRALLGAVFDEVAVTGLFGSARVMEFEARRARAARRILRLDPLRLRRLLPATVERAAFARLALAVRGQVAAAAPEVTGIGEQDFVEAAGDLDAAIDLVAQCCGKKAV
ncbi:MAG TPA: class I SAM-dependent methyltransferase [Planctomycetota bacterium]|nr:class I SAM-dependent methyltransferase [Planctomycetota bacterium]